jgi:uncharacterized protein (DUF2267 family)
MFDAPFEIHVHGDVLVRPDVSLSQVQDALRPLWTYVGAESLQAGAKSFYEEEPGIRFNAKERLVSMCWTAQGDEDFRQVMEEACMGLNDIAAEGAAIEVSFYDTQYDEEDEEAEEADSKDDFMMCFVGPTPASILQVQRDLMVRDVVHVMERHFDPAELDPVVSAIDQLFANRFDALMSSMQLGRPPRGGSGSGHGGGGRKPRHLH